MSDSQSLNVDQSADSPKQPKSRSGPECLGLSRCAGCYNQKASVRWGDDGESSSSAEDSGPEMDCESTSSSSSCCSVALTPEPPEMEKTSPVCEDAAAAAAAAPGSRGEEGDGREETGETGERRTDTNRLKGMNRRAPLVKSFSLPTSFTPHLAPLSLLPRPPSVVSTLHLEVLPDDASFTIRQHLSERGHRKTGGGYTGLGSINNLQHPQPLQWLQPGLPWQPTLQQHPYQQQQQQQPPPPPPQPHQYQQPPPPLFPPLSAQGQGLPPPPTPPRPPPPLPVLHPPALHAPPQLPNAPQTHPHAFTAHPCWFCYRMHLPYTYWSHHSGAQLHR